jgi:hypothetical protein
MPNDKIAGKQVERGAVRFKRSKYSSAAYTWAEVYDGAYWQSLGDPYPSDTWPRCVLAAEVSRVLDNADIQDMTEEMLDAEIQICEERLLKAREWEREGEISRWVERQAAIEEVMKRLPAMA